MANAEKNQGVVNKGIEGWQKINKITFAVGVSAGVAGILFGMPWLATLGFGSAAVDAGQIILLNKAKEKRNNQREKVIYKASTA